MQIEKTLKTYFLVVSIAFHVDKQNLRLNNLKTRTAMNAKILVFVVCVEVINIFVIK